MKLTEFVTKKKDPNPIIRTKWDPIKERVIYFDADDGSLIKETTKEEFIAEMGDDGKYFVFDKSGKMYLPSIKNCRCACFKTPVTIEDLAGEVIEQFKLCTFCGKKS